MNDSSTLHYSYENGVNLSAAILILLIGVFGAVCNFTVIVFFITGIEKTSFSLICFFRSVFNFYILVTSFLGLFLPSTILGYSPYSNAAESWNVNLSMSLYLGNEYQIIVVALNRFCALFFPRQYPKIFAIGPTCLVLALFYIYRLIVVIYMTARDVGRGCFYSYSPVTLSWQFPPDDVCLFDDNILLIILATFISMTCINIVTFLRIIKFYRSFDSHDMDSQRRIRKNAVLFLQTILQDSLYLVDLSFTFKLSTLSAHRFWTFVSVTLVWECVHSIDGFIMLLFNERFSSFLRARRESAVTSSIVLPPKSAVFPLVSVE